MARIVTVKGVPFLRFATNQDEIVCLPLARCGVGEVGPRLMVSQAGYQSPPYYMIDDPAEIKSNLALFEGDET